LSLFNSHTYKLRHVAFLHEAFKCRYIQDERSGVTVLAKSLGYTYLENPYHPRKNS